MILCSGCFDGLHAGHVRYLKAAAGHLQRWEPLTVALAPDDYIRRVKGREPRWSVSDRADTVEQLQMVDVVMVHSTWGAQDVIRWLRPRLFIKGIDWRDLITNTEIPAACKEAGTQLVFVETPGVHTSEAFA